MRTGAGCLRVDDMVNRENLASSVERGVCLSYDVKSGCEVNLEVKRMKSES